MSDEVKKTVAIPDVFRPLYSDNESDLFVITGGRGSAKTWNVTFYVFACLCMPTYFRALVTRYNFGSIKDSLKPAIEKHIYAMNQAAYFDIQTDRIIHKQTGNTAIFRGIKKQELSQQKGKGFDEVNCLIIDEAQEFTKEDEFWTWYRSIRVKKHGVKNKRILVLNPTHKKHWIYQRFFAEPRIPEGYNGFDNSGVNIRYIHSSYLDCIQHLPDDIIREYESLKERDSEKYRVEVSGGWYDDNEKALFRWEWINRNRIKHRDMKQTRETIIIVDPAADGSEEYHDKHGILVQSIDNDEIIYTTEDHTIHGTVADCASVALNLYRKYHASCIVVEKNNGGKWITTVFNQMDNFANIIEVTASQGKLARMEPAAAYCERDKMKFVGSFPELENQLCTYTGDSRQRSPNNYDCFAWGYHYFSGKYGARGTIISASGLT